MSAPQPPHNPFEQLSPITRAVVSDIATDRQNQASVMEQQRVEKFAENLVAIQAVPELVKRIVTYGPQVAEALRTEVSVQNGSETQTVIPVIEPNTVYMTKHDFHHEDHHSGHPSASKRSPIHPLEGKSKRPAAFSRGSATAGIYDAHTVTPFKDIPDDPDADPNVRNMGPSELREARRERKNAIKDNNRIAKRNDQKRLAPRGWSFGIRGGGSKFGMLGEDGTIYDINEMKMPRDPQRGKSMIGQPKIGVGEHTDSGLWRYLPSSKVAAALIDEVPTHDNEDKVYTTGAAVFGSLVGPNWASEADPATLISALAPELQNTVLQRLYKNGSMDNVEAEIRHLAQIGQGLADLAIHSGKFEQPEPAPAPTLAEYKTGVTEEEQEKIAYVQGILPDIDNLELAVKHGYSQRNKTPDQEDEYMQNLMRLREYNKHLEALGVKRIQASDTSTVHMASHGGPQRIATYAPETVFDPHYHEAIGLSADSLPPDTPNTIERISKVLRSGYMLENGKLIRPTMVETRHEYPAGYVPGTSENSDDDQNTGKGTPINPAHPPAGFGQNATSF